MLPFCLSQHFPSALSCSLKGQPHGDAVTCGLTRIPDSSRTSRRVGNVPFAEVVISIEPPFRRFILLVGRTREDDLIVKGHDPNL